ncbi:ABC transporter permease subunit [Nonomuraea lactucae]|uniref:ABC transporter permease subunit n=1 Tax=Nonomuraea lactucae TaxID=2249762 RepID=UPI000DE3D7F7|nr:ABC transporter permease subunit [Nonomuraea lactucae]
MSGWRAPFARPLRAEWTKFRTVRGWVVGMVAATLVTVLLGLLSAAGSRTSCSAGPVEVPCPVPPVGPEGQAVTDKFYFVHKELRGDGAITARVTSMTGRIRLPDATPGVRNVAAGLVPWAKAGVIVKESTRQGSAYAAVMVTGEHGVRMQHDYVHDVAGRPGGVSAGSPRWLRLTRSGDTLTGYESGDGEHWTRVGVARLTGLPATVRVGLFATSPGDVTLTQGSFGGTVGAARFSEATAVFDRVGLRGAASDGAWSRDDIGVTIGPDGTPHHPGRFGESGGTFTVTGVGDIAPTGEGRTIESTLSGLPAGLIVVIVVAVLFITAEHRRGLIRTSLLAEPRRGRALAAKAVVIAAVTSAAGLAATVPSVAIGTRILRANGNQVLPVGTFTEVRVVAGVAALLAAVAVLSLALGALFRRGAAAVTTAVAVIVLPYVIATTSVLPLDAARWLLRVTPAAGFAIQQSIPEYAYVTGPYVPSLGYYPLPPWAGLAVVCAYAALALGLAAFQVRRRDA